MNQNDENNKQPEIPMEEEKIEIMNDELEIEDNLSPSAQLNALMDKEVEDLRKEANDYRHKYLHLLADSDNARKRLQKDREEMIQYSNRTIFADFLNPIDHLENALKYTEEASPEVKHWATGFKMILNQFKEVLANNGVQSFDSVGKPFDPHLHEAIEMVETLEPSGIVVEENVKGYTIKGKTLRPARVKVSKKPEETTAEDTIKED